MADLQQAVRDIFTKHGATMPSDNLIRECVREMIRLNFGEYDTEKFVLHYFSIEPLSRDPNHDQDEDEDTLPISREKVAEIVGGLAGREYAEDDDFMGMLMNHLALNKVPEDLLETFIADYLSVVDEQED